MKFKVGDRVLFNSSSGLVAPPGTVMEIKAHGLALISWDEEPDDPIIQKFDRLVLIKDPNEIMKEIL